MDTVQWHRTSCKHRKFRASVEHLPKSKPNISGLLHVVRLVHQLAAIIYHPINFINLDQLASAEGDSRSKDCLETFKLKGSRSLDFQRESKRKC